ncbi:hypothetical protein WL057_17720 [Vibrio alginolyticus]|uniref:hypothetical protein n=1 Tax=Vibrio alginolyticus TaxID=663 RepID=UPI00215FC2F9|nr:hypothetical protein [Vibrio alginolyticus]MCS0080806.1 hypothetical protein [Vibrio alginolyticus]
MRQGNKKSEKLTNFNKSVGEAYHVSKNGVLTVDVQDEAFRDEFLKQLRKIRSRRELKRRELQAREAARQHA